MKRVSNNIKFYTFIEILKTYSDENVSLSIKEIQHHMRKRLGVDVDRRTIYAYIKDMKTLGIDVSDYDKSKEGYYINSNCFEPGEVRILADAVLTSNFVTKRRTQAILEKLKSFNSIYQNKDFLKDVYIEDIPKSTNEEIFVSMDRISEAIKFSRKIRFNYCEYNYFKELECKVDENGNLREYVKSPVYMVLRNKNYYLVCADEDSEVFQHFRIDRMLNVSVIGDEKIMDLSGFEDCRNASCRNINGKNINNLNLIQFGMECMSSNTNAFTKRRNIVIVEFKKNLMNYLLDEFGDSIYIMEKENYKNNNLKEDITNNVHKKNYLKGAVKGAAYNLNKNDVFMQEVKTNNYNNLQSRIKRENLESKILKKILGKADYEKYVLSGKYIENSLIREKLGDFSNALNRIICGDCDKEVDKTDKCSENAPKFGEEVNKCSEDVHGFSKEMNKCSENVHGFSKEVDECSKNVHEFSKEVDKFGKIDKSENEKSYIGIFVEKESGYLSKNIMKFGTDMKVVWPSNVRNEIVDQLKSMLALYE